MTDGTTRWLFAEQDFSRDARQRHDIQPMRGLDRLADLDAVVEQERARGAQAS